MINFSDIIIKPVITEKGSILRSNNSYVFLVGQKSTKIDIKIAVEKLFNVKVEKINTINIKPRVKRLGKSIGRTSSKKKAYIKIKQGQTIDLVERMA